MTPSKTTPEQDTPDQVHDMVFSHPVADSRVVPRPERSTPVPCFDAPGER